MGKEKDVKMGPEASLLVVFVALILGLAAVGGGIYAEIIRKQEPSAEDVTPSGRVLKCAFQSHRAYLIAVCAAGSLTLSHVLVSVLGGCVCCCTLIYARGSAHNWSMFLFATAWAYFFMAQFCFLSGAFINEYHTSKTFFEYDYDLKRCYRTRPFMYYAAAGFSLLHTVFIILFYGQAQKAKYEAWVEQGAPTPHLYSVKTMKSFVIAGPAKKGPLRDLSEPSKPFLSSHT